MELKSHFVPGLQMSPSAMLCGVDVGAAVVGAGAAFEDSESGLGAKNHCTRKSRQSQSQAQKRFLLDSLVGARDVDAAAVTACLRDIPCQAPFISEKNDIRSYTIAHKRKGPHGEFRERCAQLQVAVHVCSCQVRTSHCAAAPWQYVISGSYRRLVENLGNFSVIFNVLDPLGVRVSPPPIRLCQVPSTCTFSDSRITELPPISYNRVPAAFSVASSLLVTSMSSSNAAPGPSVHDTPLSPHHVHSDSFTLNFMVLASFKNIVSKHT